ncbi:aminoglycoside phosphotransferase family protein [Lentisphaerota bacterium WC36G]|nr:aminoglycoside phosphotransferase family protein [Lentisphaerae bacterium WC36]
MIKHDIEKVGAMFEIPGDFIFAERYGSGHINETYSVEYNQGGTTIRYIFQLINKFVFKNPEKLMDNIYRVTSHIHEKLKIAGDKSRHTLTVIKSNDNLPYAIDENGNYWRVYVFVEKAKTYDIIETPDQAYQAARAFGEFQKMLVDLPGGRLFETIKDFHNTPKRVERLKEVIAEDKLGRVKECQAEIDFVMSRIDDTEKLIQLQEAGKIPERITHNDTKLNNVMLDYLTGEGICVIDLDTVMPGLVHYDFGDLVRTSTSPAAEDEQDLSKVYMQFDMFEAILRGYMAGAGEFLNETEKKLLPFSGKLIPLEIGVRFLTDHLEGDVYFRIHRDDHNLDRCRTQFKLVESIEEQYDKMMELLESI